MKYFMLPPARLISGSIYNFVKANRDEPDSREIVKFGLAIPKEGEASFLDTEWGQTMYEVACEPPFNQSIANRQAFSWKVVDGDSDVENSEGKRPCDQPNHPGNWIIYLSSSLAPQVVSAMQGGVKALPEKDAIKRGYWVEVQVSCKPNGNMKKPGVYMNHEVVCLVGYDEEIKSADIDPMTLGFGQRKLPAHVRTTPGASRMQPAARQAAPSAGARPGAAPAARQAAAPSAGTRPGAAPAARQATPAARPAPVRQPARKVRELCLTDAAIEEGYTKDSFAGWSDDEIVAEGWGLTIVMKPDQQFTSDELGLGAESLVEGGYADYAE